MVDYFLDSADAFGNAVLGDAEGAEGGGAFALADNAAAYLGIGGPTAELKGSIGEGPNHSNHSNHSNSFKIGIFH